MKRLNLAVTAQVESNILDYLVSRLPRWVTPDLLTLIALLSAIIGGSLYLFVDKNPYFLLLINVCLFIHWFGDSLDGRLARLRKESRPNYGYYIDHIFDSVAASFFIGGITVSSLTITAAWVWVLALMFLSMIHVFLKTKVNRVFEFSIQQMGPTEARFGLVVLNFLIFFAGNPEFNFFEVSLKLMDIVGAVIALGFLLVLIPEITRTIITLDRRDREISK